MSGSLSTHVDNLKSVRVENFKITQKYFPNADQFQIVTRKGVFPYEWMGSVKALDQTKLPTKTEFFSSLNEEGITDQDSTTQKQFGKPLR